MRSTRSFGSTGLESTRLIFGAAALARVEECARRGVAVQTIEAVARRRGPAPTPPSHQEPLCVRGDGRATA
ncbi:MAG: hypothetical protein ACQGVK_09665 [Myxococcota bacterium]